jgi:hypothetical protein
MKMSNILPVAISILIIIGVAVLEKQSKLVAAITATMPIKVPLSLWVVYVASSKPAEAMHEYSKGLMIGIIPTLGFIIAAWLAARAGLKIIPILAVGYGVWGLGVGLTFLFRSVLGV